MGRKSVKSLLRKAGLPIPTLSFKSALRVLSLKDLVKNKRAKKG